MSEQERRSANMSAAGSPHRYGRIMAALRADILGGALQPGDGLPSERALEERFGVSRITVRRALEELAQERLIERRQGRRTVVLGPAPPRLVGTVAGGHTDMLQLGRVTEARVRTFEWRIASAGLAEKLDLAEGDQVLYVARVRFRDGAPVFHTEAWLPRAVGLLIDRSMLERTPILDLMMEGGVEVASSRQIMSAAPCPDWLAPLLDIAVGDPVFRLDRTVRDGADRPVQFLVSMFRWDRFSYQIEALHSPPGVSPATAALRARHSGLVAIGALDDR
ncbi:GntR family transcriptional regulator [uncultured Enterovirga sp.]|uniref:GntR family transcriptional regulator n=1 Tax=uncultured Enterovirga sp. TaxID=2026352 RepID=UPI0035CA1FC1